MKFLHRFRSFFHKDKLDAEMTAEMQSHVDLQTEHNRKAGMNPDEARYAALRQFGNVASIQELARERRGWMWVEHLARDTRHAVRLLAKAPLLTTVIVLSLGIGIGSNTVIFSWLRGLVFLPIPGVKDATHFLLIEPRGDQGSYPGASWPEYQDLRERLPGLTDLLAYRTLPLNYGEPGREERLYSQLVSGNYFTALGLKAAQGRLLRPEDALRPGGTPVAVVSHDFWRSHLASAPDAVGRMIKLNDRPMTVVGVAPEGFEGTMVGLSFDCWVPATMAPVLLAGSAELTQRDVRGYSLMGAPAFGAGQNRIQAELTTAMRELARLYPATNTGFTGEVLPFWRAPRGAQMFLLPALAALQGMLLLVLLVVCTNAANLLLARATARKREVGVRLALGASPGQILRLFLSESLVLGALAAAVGALLAVWGTTALRTMPLPGDFPFKFHTDLDIVVLAFTALLGLGCALLFGLAPALQSARTDTQLALRAARHVSGRSRMGSLLMGLEAALALLVLIIAAMFMRNFLETRVADPGFRTRGVLLASYDLTSAGYDNTRSLALMDDLINRLKATPGIEGAAIASWVPLDFHGMPQAAFSLVGRVRPDGGNDRALTYTVTPGYFQGLRLPFVAGHDFAPLTDTKQPRQIVVNEEFVHRYISEGPALGRQIAGKTRNYEIVGVVRNALYESFGEPRKPIIYFSYRDYLVPSGQIHVFTSGPESALAPDLQRIVREINPALSLYGIRTLTEHVDKNLFFRKIPARLFVVLGPLILLLAAIGIYAVVAYGVAQRTTEIGVRLALGASRQQVVRQIVRETLRVVCLGALPAWLIAIVVMIHLRGGVLNAPILVGMPLLLAGVAWLAAWLPARRAAQVDPVVALRAE